MPPPELSSPQVAGTPGGGSTRRTARQEDSVVVTGHSLRRTPAARAAATAADAARPRPRGPHRRLARFVVDVWSKSDRDRLLGLAGENAFMAVLTVFPALLVFASVLGQLRVLIGQDNAVRVQNAVLSFLDRLLTSSANGALTTAKHLFQTGGNALTLTSALALVSLSTAFAGIINTVTIAYDVKDSRGWWRRRWLGLLIGTGSVLTGAVVVTAIVVGPLFGRASDVVASVGLSKEYAFLWSSLRWPGAIASLVAWATTLNIVCPDRPVRFREALPGGLLTALLWLGASVGFSVYLRLVVPASPVLGALGGGLILMTWFYLLCLSLLIGAEVNAVRLARRAARQAS